MQHKALIRNANAREYLDIFIVSAASSILLLRFFLHVSGYPTVGGEKYHVAHMLWGGICMLIAFVLNFAFLGHRMQRFIALLGGVGFGIFIDEIGKLLTKDNDYFFRPSVGIIYAIFVALYLAISFMTREQKLTSEEYQLNALRQLEEAVHSDMDRHERAATRELLQHSNRSSEITRRLHDLLYALPVAPTPKPGPVVRWRRWVSKWYRKMWHARGSRLAVKAFFVVETLAFLAAVAAAVYSNLDDVRDFFIGTPDYGHGLVIGQLVSTFAATFLVVAGLIQLKGSRLKALEWFRRATLINLLLTEFFLFSRIQFGAMASFIFNLVLLSLINAALTQERQFAAENAPQPLEGSRDNTSETSSPYRPVRS